MSGYLSGYENIVSVMPPRYCTAVGGETLMSDFIKLDQYDKVSFVGLWAPISTVGSSDVTPIGLVSWRLWSAWSGTGGGQAVVNCNTTVGSTGGLGTVIERANAIVITNATLSANAQTFVINDITFTMSTLAAVTTATFDATRRVTLEAVPSAAGCSATLEHFAAYINHPSLGVEGVLAYVANTSGRLWIATSSSNQLYITGQGNKTVSITSVSSDQIKPCGYSALLETNGAEIASQNASHKYVAIEMTGTTHGGVAAIAIRHTPRYAYSSTDFMSAIGTSTV